MPTIPLIADTETAAQLAAIEKLSPDMRSLFEVALPMSTALFVVEKASLTCVECGSRFGEQGQHRTGCLLGWICGCLRRLGYGSMAPLEWPPEWSQLGPNARRAVCEHVTMTATKQGDLVVWTVTKPGASDEEPAAMGHERTILEAMAAAEESCGPPPVEQPPMPPQLIRNWRRSADYASIVANWDKYKKPSMRAKDGSAEMLERCREDLARIK